MCQLFLNCKVSKLIKIYGKRTIQINKFLNIIYLQAYGCEKI